MLKRRSILIILLLALIGGGVAAYKHWNKQFQSDEQDAPFSVKEVELKRDFANAVLTLTVDYDNRDGKAEITTAALKDAANGLRLLTSSGKAPDLFFLPGVYPPVIKPGKHKQVEVIYWLSTDHLQSGLHLECNGKRVTVKKQAPFDLTRIENQTSVHFTDSNWSQP